MGGQIFGRAWALHRHVGGGWPGTRPPGSHRVTRTERIHGRLSGGRSVSLVCSRSLALSQLSSSAMSRLPQPSSSSARPDVRARLKSTPSIPAPRSPITPGVKPRAKTPSVTPTPTLRPQRSLQSLKPKSPTKSPVKKPPPLPTQDDTPSRPKLSIREQIALKRAEAKKITPGSSPVKSDFSGLEDASPHTFNQPPEQDVDLGRWSVKETIERARSSGMYSFQTRQTCQAV